MAKQSRESMISELNARKIGYKDEMSNRELLGLLDKVNAKEEAEEKDAKLTAEKKSAAEAGAEAASEEKADKEPLNIDYSGIKCGVSTIQDLHRRISIIEHKLGL